MEEQFARLGVAAKRVEAVTTTEVPDDRMAPHLDSNNATAMARIEVACLLSHERAWKSFLATGAAHAMILEDDVVMSEGLLHFLDASLHAELGVDLLKLETFRQNIRLGRTRRLVASRFAVRQLLSSHLGTAAYVISRARVERTLADPVARTMPVDCYFFDKRGPVLPARHIFQVEPAPAVQLQMQLGPVPVEIGRSDLEADRSRAEGGRTTLPSHQWAQAMARLKYKLRTIIETYQDLEAVCSRRRRVLFEGDPPDGPPALSSSNPGPPLSDRSRRPARR